MYRPVLKRLFSKFWTNIQSSPWMDAALSTCLGFLLAGVLYKIAISFSVFTPFETAFRDFEFTDIYYAQPLEEPGTSPVMGVLRDSNHDSNTYGTEIIPEEVAREPDSTKIVIINIQQEGRVRIAHMIEQVMRQQPRVLALDIRFIGRKDSVTDATLRDVLLKYPEIITAYMVDDDTHEITGSDPYFEQKMETAGFINFYPDKGLRVIRDYIGEKVVNNNDTIYSFAHRITSAYLERIGKEKSIESNGQIPIRYRGNVERFIHFDHTVLDQDEPIAAIKDAIVLLGYLGESGREEFDIEDKHYTPVNQQFTGKSPPDMFGVVIHANIIHMLLNSKPLTRIPLYWVLIISFIISIPITRFVIYVKNKDWLLGDLIIKVIQFSIPVLLVYLGLVAVNIDILISTKIIIILILMSISMIGAFPKVKKGFKKLFLK